MFRKVSRSFVRNGNRLFSSSKSAKPAPQLPPFNHTPKPYNGPSAEEVLRLRKEYLNPALLLYYKKPVLTVEGKMQYLFDEKGRRYLDFFAGIVTVSVGHQHPEVVKAGVEQLQTLSHTTNIYLNHQHALFGKELAAKLPPKLNKIYVVNTGGEANDLAITMARLYTGNYDFIGLRNGYHGMTMGTMNLTSLSTWRYPIPTDAGFRHAQFPDTFRGFWGRDDPEAGIKYARDVKEIIQYDTPGKIAGFIAEPIQGVGGAVELPPGYLKEVYKHVKAAGGVCVSDEVQTGFGRLGSHYWGFQYHGVEPDIVTMAKGIGNGAPLAAVATTEEIAKSLTQKAHFNTFGGNPVSCAMGRAVLRVIDQEKLQNNSLEVGRYLKQKMLDLQKKYDIIGDVRGTGLMLGMEFVKDRKTKEPATEELLRVFERTKDLGLLVGKGGLTGSSFRIKPPMCITKKDVDFFYDVFDTAISEL